jgi:hypothetical protein
MISALALPDFNQAVNDYVKIKMTDKKLNLPYFNLKFLEIEI